MFIRACSCLFEQDTSNAPTRGSLHFISKQCSSLQGISCLNQFWVGKEYKLLNTVHMCSRLQKNLLTHSPSLAPKPMRAVCWCWRFGIGWRRPLLCALLSFVTKDIMTWVEHFTSGAMKRFGMWGNTWNYSSTMEVTANSKLYTLSMVVEKALLL